MGKSETRWLFWDGVPNINGGTTHLTIDHKFTLNSKVTLWTAAAAPVVVLDPSQHAAIVVVKEPRVRVLHVDPWFVPMTHLLGIQIKLRDVPAKASVLLRIYAGKKCVFHEIYAGDDLLKLQTADIRTADATRGVARKNPFEQKSLNRKAYLDYQPAETSRYTVRCWIGAKVDTFNGVFAITKDHLIPGHPDTVAPEEDDGGAVFTDRLGRNQTVVSNLVDKIMGGTSALIINDSESTDQVMEKGKSKRAEAATYPEFRPLMQETLYKAVFYSPLGRALIADVAADANLPGKTVNIFPTMSLHGNLGGCGVSDAYPDDFRIEQAILALKKLAAAGLQGVNTEIKDGADDFKDDTGTLSAVELIAEAKKPTATAKFKFIARRHLYRKIGSSGAGARSRFYFNLGFLPGLEAGSYQVGHHVLKKQYPLTVLGKARTLNEAGITFTEKNILTSSVSIETPLFLAFLHEMVHARRMQVGMNSEWDSIEGLGIDKAGGWHPKSMLGELRAEYLKLTEPPAQKAYADFGQNLITGYNLKNREEYDTVEGEGVPVNVSGADADRAKELKLPVTGGKVDINENTIRLDLGIDLRYRYEDNRTLPRPDSHEAKAAYHNFKPGFAVRRKFLPPVKNMKMRVPTAPTLDQIHAGYARMITDVGLTIPALQIVPDENCVLLDAVRFGLAYRFGVLAKRKHADHLKSDQNEYEGICQNLADTRKWIEDELPHFLPLLKGVDADPKTASTLVGETARLNVMKLFQAVAKLEDSGDRQLLLDKMPQLSGSVAFGNGVLAQGGLKMSTPVVRDGNLREDLSIRALNLQHRSLADVQYGHMLVHEAMHVQSFECDGFNAWPQPASDSALWTKIGTPKFDWNAFRNIFNEGTTELLARIISYRLNKAAGAPVAEVENIGDLLSYEFPTRYVAGIVRKLDGTKGAGNGIKLLGKAFLGGQFDALNAALADLPKVLFVEGARLSLNNPAYFDDSDTATKAVKELAKNDLLVLGDAATIQTSLAESKYSDPVLLPAPLLGDLAGYKPSYSNAL